MGFFKKNIQLTTLLVIIALGSVIRLQNFNLAPIDAHPMRQTDTECVAYNFAVHDPNILRPMACLIRPQENKEGYFFLELPLYQYTLSIFYRLFGTDIAVARIFNISLYLGATISIYYFIKKILNQSAALISSFIFSFAPSSIFFVGHAIHPDVFAVSTMLLAFALFVYSADKKNILLFCVSFILFGASIATRPFGLLALPSFIYLLYLKKSNVSKYIFLAISSISLYLLWRVYLNKFPKSYHEWEYWVLQGRELLVNFEVLKRLILKNIIGEVAGKFISLLALFGLITEGVKKNKAVIFSILWLLGVPIYWLLIPNGNIFHQYYANAYLVPIIILATVGFYSLINLIENKYLKVALITFIAILVVYNGYRTSSYFFNDIERSDYIKISREIKKYIPENKKIVYTATLNSVPMSLSHRQGWVLGGAPVDVEHTALSILNMQQYGAEYVVMAINNTDINDLEVKKIEENSELIVENKWVRIFKLP